MLVVVPLDIVLEEASVYEWVDLVKYWLALWFKQFGFPMLVLVTIPDKIVDFNTRSGSVVMDLSKPRWLPAVQLFHPSVNWMWVMGILLIFLLWHRSIIVFAFLVLNWPCHKEICRVPSLSGNKQYEFCVHPVGSFVFDHYYHKSIHTFQSIAKVFCGFGTAQIQNTFPVTASC